MKKTKVICTMGPNTNDRELIKQLALSGMDIARFNFSHGDHEEQAGRFALVKSVREEINKPIATLLDTKGPEIRTGVLKDDKKVTLKEGQKFTLTTRDIVGDDTIDMITYAGLPADVANGNTILIDDGLIELRVEEVVDGTDIVCTVINGGELGSKKGVNVPNVSIKLPGITDKDKDDIIFGIEQGFDFIAASFVRNAACIQEIKELLWSHNADIPVIAKIENAEGIKNLDEIIRVADGIMVARGDMGVEIPAEQVPHIQKEIIKKCNLPYHGAELIADKHLKPCILDYIRVMANSENYPLDLYYKTLSQYPEVMLLKLSNRAHTCTTLINSSDNEIKKYVDECETYIYPLCEYGIKHYPEYSNSIQIMYYQIRSLCNIARSLRLHD